MTKPQTYTLRYPCGQPFQLRDILRRAVDWLEANNRLSHMVEAYSDDVWEHHEEGGCDIFVGAVIVIVLNDPDTAMLLKLSLITD
jgi:hypothetical protein